MRNHMPKLVAFIVSIFVVIGMIPGIAAASDHDHDSHSHDHDRQSAEVTKQNKENSDSANKSDAPKPTDVTKTPDKPKADDQSTHQVDKVEVPTPTEPTTVQPATTPPAPSTPPSTTDEDGDSHHGVIQQSVSPCQEVTLDYELSFSIDPTDSSMSKNPQWFLDGKWIADGFSGTVNVEPGMHDLMYTFSNYWTEANSDDHVDAKVEVKYCPIHHPNPPPENPPPTTPPVAPPLPAENVAKAWVECDSGVHTLRTQLVSGDSNVTFSPESGHKLANGETVEVIASWPNAGQAQKITVTAPANGCTTPATANTTSLAMTGAGDGLRTFGFSAIGALVIGLFALWYTKERRKLNQKA